MVTAITPAQDALEVLLIEDDEGDAVLVREMLADSAAETNVRWVRTAADAERALDSRVDCILLDLGLPDAAGLEALVRIRAAAPETALLVLTGATQSDRGVEAVAAGAQDYLVKGQVDGEVLARALRYAVERRRADLSQHELYEARLVAAENARLQRGLLPRPIVSDPALHVVTDYRAGGGRTLLGGDFFDVVERPDGTLHALIGDVCGHGPDEAALGVGLRIAWRTLAMGGHDAGEMLGTLTEVLVHERHREDLFATLCAVSVAPDRRTASVRLAGHPAPLLLTGSDARALVAQPLPPLGVAPVGPWPATTVELPAAPWSLLLYTDGLIEGYAHGRAEEGGGSRLGEAGLHRLLREALPLADASRGDLLEHLIAMAASMNGGALMDDVAACLISCV